MNSGFCHRSQYWLATIRRPTGSTCQPQSLAGRVGLDTPPKTLPSMSSVCAEVAVSQTLR